MNEAARMWEEGVASADDIDTATRVGFGLRFAVLGMVEFIDWGGVDTLLYASRYLRDELEAERFDPPQVVADRVERGATGMSAGEGLRDFAAIDRPEFQRQRTEELVALLRHLDLLPRRAH
jgi:3-hydroxybutyryl-CoA dehydrogenase